LPQLQESKDGVSSVYPVVYTNSEERATPANGRMIEFSHSKTDSHGAACVARITVSALQMNITYALEKGTGDRSHAEGGPGDGHSLRVLAQSAHPRQRSRWNLSGCSSGWRKHVQLRNGDLLLTLGADTPAGNQDREAG
jgi:hypothetical protein